MRPRRNWTRNALTNLINLLIGLPLISLIGCREFYDDEFEEFQAQQNRTTGGSGGSGEDVSYTSTLTTIDPTLPDLNGTANVNVVGDEVEVSLSVNGIPLNINQIHYSFINADCSTQVTTIPVEPGETRSFTLSENLSTSALQLDLRSSGASTNDINLAGRSFIVRGFSNFTTVPNPSGISSIALLCGEVNVANNEEDGTTGVNTGTIGTTGGIGTTTGGIGTTTGTIGTATGGFGTADGGFGTTGGTFGSVGGVATGTGTTGGFGTVGGVGSATSTTGGFGTATTGGVGTPTTNETSSF